jgi:hypothetical protein
MALEGLEALVFPQALLEVLFLELAVAVVVLLTLQQSGELVALVAEALALAAVI